MVLQSYLELLVNTRSELALARVLNVPNRELTHEAFTELKREAKTKNMTMYQVYQLQCNYIFLTSNTIRVDKYYVINDLF